MFRSTIINFSLLLLFILQFVSCSNTKPIKEHQNAEQSKRPNIIFILADDLGIGQVGAYRKNKIATPHIDKLAAEGLRFTQAYAGNTVCSPSRMALFTGRDGQLLHSIDNSIKLREHDYTFAHLLQNSGYDTRLIGKYGIGDSVGKNDPISMGFNHWFGFMGNLEAHRQYPQTIWRDNKQEKIEENISGEKKDRILIHDLFTSEAINYIGQKHEKPFFLFLAYTFPHAELASPDSTYKLYENKFEEEPYPGMSTGKAINRFTPYYPEPVAKPRATLAGMIAAIDRDVGRINQQLEKLGLADDTIVIFSSDNGPHHEGGADPIFFEASAPYRGIKRDLYEGGIHVPFIVKWPNHIAKGSTNSTPIAFWDILPTFAEITDIDVKSTEAKYNGVSFKSSMMEGQTLPERMMYWGFRTRIGDKKTINVRQAARKGDWKAVRYGLNQGIELYNLKNDPGEENNLAHLHPAKVEDFRSFLDKQIAP